MEYQELKQKLDAADYVYDDVLATVLYVALTLGRPLLIEGAAGVGKTEVAKVMAAALDRELVRRLKAQGYGIYLLSNASTALRGYFPRIPGSECFDGLLVSAEENLLKPQWEIYHTLYRRFHLDPQRCFFVDDAPANVEAALCTGMKGTIFRGDVHRLRREMREAGIRCPMPEDV